MNTVPGLVWAVAARKRYLLYRRFKGQPIQDVFQRIYAENGWGSDESVSGLGSELGTTEVLRGQLSEVIGTIGARSLFDIPCGDFNWMKSADLRGVDRYIGADIVPDLINTNQEEYGRDGIEFREVDITTDPLPEVDLILCRDLFIHFSNEDIWKSLNNIKKSKSKYILLTTFTNFKENYDIITRSVHEINLRLPPFSFCEPIQYLDEDSKCGFDKKLGLWRISDLPME